MNGLIKEYQKVEPVTFPSTAPENPFVSVIVQTFQHAAYIAQCLDGILMQKTDFPFEILVGEDESTDGTREICIEYAKKYPDKIRLFLHSRENVIFINNHPSGRFNLLWNLYHAKGKYIAWVDGDDYWTNPSKLQKQVDFLEKNSKYSMTCTNFSVVDEKGNLIEKTGWGKKQQKPVISHLNMLEYYTPKTLTAVIRKQALSNEFPDYSIQCPNGDSFFFSFASQSGPARFLNINTGCYRVNKGGIWSMKTGVKQNEMKYTTFIQLKKYFTKPEEQKAINARLSRSYIIKSKYLLKKGIILGAASNIIQSLQLSTKPYKDFFSIKF